MKYALQSFIAHLCLEFVVDRPLKHSFLKYSLVIHSLATVLSVGPWLQQNLHGFELFEIKSSNFSL